MKQDDYFWVDFDHFYTVHHFKGSWSSCLNWLEPPKAFIELTPNLDLIIISMKDKNIFVPIEQEKEAKKSSMSKSFGFR